MMDGLEPGNISSTILVQTFSWKCRKQSTAEVKKKGGTGGVRGGGGWSHVQLTPTISWVTNQIIHALLVWKVILLFQF